METSAIPPHQSTVPGSTIRGTFNTYEDRTPQSLVDALGHVVSLKLEGLVHVEQLSWAEGLRLTVPEGATASVEVRADGTSVIRISPKPRTDPKPAERMALIMGATYQMKSTGQIMELCMGDTRSDSFRLRPVGGEWRGSEQEFRDQFIMYAPF